MKLRLKCSCASNLLYISINIFVFIIMHVDLIFNIVEYNYFLVICLNFINFKTYHNEFLVQNPLQSSFSHAIQLYLLVLYRRPFLHYVVVFCCS